MKTCWKSWKRKQALIKGTKLAGDLKWLSVIKSFQGEKVVSSSLIKRKTRRVHLCSCFKGASKKYVVEEEREEKKCKLKGERSAWKNAILLLCFGIKRKKRKNKNENRDVSLNWLWEFLLHSRVLFLLLLLDETRNLKFPFEEKGTEKKTAEWKLLLM